MSEQTDETIRCIQQGGEAAVVAQVLAKINEFRERAEHAHAQALSESDRADYYYQASHWKEAADHVEKAASYL